MAENVVVRRSVAGSAVGVALVVALSAALVPLRSTLGIATVGLIMVVPVVAAVATGGYTAGVAGVAAGFLAYDYVFIPPYYTLSVGAARNWVPLGVYAVVMLLVAQVVGRLQAARGEAQVRAAEAQRLLELSRLLATDSSLQELLDSVVAAVRTLFDVPGVALLLPEDGDLRVAASDGSVPPLATNHPVAVGTLPGLPEVRTVALAATGRPVGVLAIQGPAATPADPRLLQGFANHAALAIERAQLRARALRAELLEEVDRLRQAVLGSVSHDLCTPLATLKVASSTLVEQGAGMDEEARSELHELLDGEIDRLSRLVNGLLDVTRHHAGALELRVQPCSLLDLLAESVAGASSSLGERDVVLEVPEDLPPVLADPVLFGQVVVNLLDNAHRHAPPGTPVTVSAEPGDATVVVAVADKGPGVAPEDREAVFDGFVRSSRGGRAGLGLWICKVFVEAHGQTIWAEDGRFAFTVERAP